MMNRNKAITSSALLGTALGILGVFFMGYITAVAIPKELYSWLGNTELTLFVIDTASQFLAFGVLAIMIGTIIGRLSKRWLLNSSVCYLAFLFYLIAGTAIINGGEISDSFSGFTPHNILSMLLVPALLLVSASLGSKRL